MSRFLKFSKISFAYDGMVGNLLEDVEALFPEGRWTGVVGANGCGKTTLLRLAAGELEPSSGTIGSLGRACYVVQRTDFPPDDLDDFLDARDAIAVAWRARLGVDSSWAGRWDTLSHGERKRAQIAAALWREPGVLALDEPTNHLDETAKAALLKALKAFSGAGLIVSHDRDFLDALCSQCLFIFPPHATMRPGGVTAGQEQDRREQSFIRERDTEAKGDARRLRDAAQRRFELAQQTAAKNKAARNARIDPQDHDGRAKRNLAKLTGKNAWAVTQSAALGKRAAKAEALRHGLAPRKEYEMGFWLNGGERSQRDYVLSLEAGELTLGDGRLLRYPEIRVKPDDRIGITGDNGIGKSTFLRHILPLANVPDEKLLVVPQEISEVESAKILAEVKELGSESLGRVMTSVSRLGSRPGRLLASESPSPGEIRKILLAMGVDRGIHLLVMDEPTNHLDLPGIECLEDALAECPCAMLLVSHDRRFLSKVAQTEWHFEETDPGVVELVRLPFASLV